MTQPGKYTFTSSELRIAPVVYFGLLPYSPYDTTRLSSPVGCGSCAMRRRCSASLSFSAAAALATRRRSSARAGLVTGVTFD